jgi:hypothetical protein
MNICRLILLLTIAVSGMAFAQAGPTGSILCAYWREIPGTTVADLNAVPAYPNFPNEQVMLDRL